MTGSKPHSWRDSILDVIALLGGALFSLSLSPLGFWPLAFASPVALYAATQKGSVRRTVLRFYLYNVGLFGVGVSWIFFSINDYGNASVPLSGMLVLLFVLAYSLTCLPQAALYARYFRVPGLFGASAFSGLWVLQEWFRSWFLTGFPWLFVGYGAMGTPLENIAPVAGVFGVGFYRYESICCCRATILEDVASRAHTGSVEFRGQLSDIYPSRAIGVCLSDSGKYRPACEVAPLQSPANY
ncbi:MAG: hypothetical protein O3C68_05345 [Proteobacteria bacterium]|nr:hypothetical protein [Pseudomonadota bacterium]